MHSWERRRQVFYVGRPTVLGCYFKGLLASLCGDRKGVDFRLPVRSGVLLCEASDRLVTDLRTRSHDGSYTVGFSSELGSKYEALLTVLSCEILFRLSSYSVT